MKTWHHQKRKDWKAKERIFLAVPVLGGRMNLAVHQFISLLHELRGTADCPWTFDWLIVNDKRPVEYARNYLVGEFLRSNADRLWFLDADMIPDENTLQLLHVEGDIVAARAFAWDHRSDKAETGLKMCCFYYNQKGDYKFNPIIPEQGDTVLDADAVGTATMLIRREVLEDTRLWLPSQYEGLDGMEHDLLDERETDKEWCPPIFRTQHKPNGCPLRGEDLDFSLRAKNLGYSVRCHVGIGVGHAKEVNLEELAKFANKVVHRAMTRTGVEPNVTDDRRVAVCR